MIGYNPDSKSLGKRSALNAHAAFDEADAENTIEWIGASVFDPTRENLRVKLPWVTRLAASASGQIELQMKRQIQILGTYKLDDKTDSFSGTVTFDERENSIITVGTCLTRKENELQESH